MKILVIYLNTTFNFHDFRLPPRFEICAFCGWGRGCLRGQDRYFITYVSGQPIGPIFSVQAPRHLKMGLIGCLVTSVRNYHSVLCEISEQPRPQLLIYFSS
jgi:hypothetical protein